MDEKDIFNDSLELNGTNAEDGFSGEEKEAELPPAILHSSDEAINDDGLDGQAQSKRRGKIRWVILCMVIVVKCVLPVQIFFLFIAITTDGSMSCMYLSK